MAYTPFFGDYVAAGDEAEKPAAPLTDPGINPNQFSLYLSTDATPQKLELYDPVNETYIRIILSDAAAATLIPFDNGGTGLAATNIQDAIAEIASASFSGDTDNVPEGLTNLYFTDERAQDAVGLILDNSFDVKFVYTDGTPTIQASAVRVLQIEIFPPGEAVTIGDDLRRIRINSLLNGWNLTAVAACVDTAPSGGPVTIQLHNVTSAADILSTEITIEAGELDSKDATIPAVINAAEDDVATGDQIRIDIDAANSAEGLIVELTFTRP